jgi:thiol-disulfide isomerase/thioredoxin
MKRIIQLFVFILLIQNTQAQTKPAASVKPATAAGKQISITLTPLKSCWVYIGSYYGKGKALVDSAYLNEKSVGMFKGNKLVGGVYFIVSPKMTIQFEFLIDSKQQFSIVGDTLQKEKVLITGSQDNDLFKNYLIYSSERGKVMQEQEAAYHQAKTNADSTKYKNLIMQGDKDLQAYREDLVKKHPNSLLAMLFNTMKRPTAPAVPIVKGKPDSLYPYRFVKDHFWDDVVFNDDRLLRTPFFESKLDDYFKYYVSPEPDSLIDEVKYILLSARTGKEIYPYLLTKFTNKYISPEFMGQDKVFLYLFENFYAKGDTILLNAASKKTITERAYSLMANQLGLPSAPLDLTDTTGKNISLYGIKAPFTVVAFWDPNCGHCKEEIPRLDSMYRAKWKALGVAIYAVNIYENENTAWKKFINEKNLRNWYHVYQTKAARAAEEKAGQPSYKQLYDVFKTPTLYLLDKDKRIIAKQLSIQQFDDLIATKLKPKS